MLASNHGDTGQSHTATGDGGSSIINGLIGLRQRPTNPMQDYVADGTRMLRWVKAAIDQYAALTGKSRQDILTEAALGITPLPSDLLDAYHRHYYGTPWNGVQQ